MVYYWCSAVGCPNKSLKEKIPGMTFHRFPKKEEQKQAWIKASGRKNWKPSSRSLLCTNHFSEDQKMRCNKIVRLKANAVPNIGLPSPEHAESKTRRRSRVIGVKRKLDLQAFQATEEHMDAISSRRRRRKPTTAVKTKAKPVAKPTVKSTAASSAEKPRYDTSLGQLTKKFLKLLFDASDGVINLNTACTLLAVPKRRLYDITNVLEGAGLIQKTSRNNIQWMGEGVPNAAELEKEIDILEAKENKLDELIYHMKSEVNTLKQTDGNYHYVTGDDLQNIYDLKKKMVVGVNIAPTGQQFIETFEKKIVLTSKSTEIEAYLFNQDISNFTNILHPGAEFKENSYEVQIKQNVLVGDFSGLDVVEAGPSYDTDTIFAAPSYGLTLSNIGSGSSYSQMCSGLTWSEGDMVIKNAFITEEDDIAPMGKNFLLQTEDQDQDDQYDLQLYNDLAPPVDNYSFSLDDGEGLTDLFDCSALN